MLNIKEKEFFTNEEQNIFVIDENQKQLILLKNIKKSICLVDLNLKPTKLVAQKLQALTTIKDFLYKHLEIIGFLSGDLIYISDEIDEFDEFNNSQISNTAKLIKINRYFNRILNFLIQKNELKDLNEPNIKRIIFVKKEL